MKLWTFTLECANDCGSKIDLRGHDPRRDETDAVAELLGWATVDKGKKVEVYCQFCIARAKRIVATVGPYVRTTAVTNKQLIEAKRK